MVYCLICYQVAPVYDMVLLDATMAQRLKSNNFGFVYITTTPRQIPGVPDLAGHRHSLHQLVLAAKQIVLTEQNNQKIEILYTYFSH